MYKARTAVAAAVVATTLSGCIIVDGEPDWIDDNWQRVQRENLAAISNLDIGMQRSVVEGRLGNPNDSEAFVREADEYRVLYYRTRHRHSDGETSRDETTPLVFRNDELIGWGDSVLASVR